jgi:hypothetical protein
MTEYQIGQRERDAVVTPWGRVQIARPTRGRVRKARDIQNQIEGLDLDDPDVSFKLWSDTLAVVLEDADTLLANLAKAWDDDEVSFGDAQDLVMFSVKSFWAAARAEKND